MNRKQFLQIWASHGVMTVTFKVFNFFLLNTLLQQYITLEQYPLVGALVYFPSVLLLLIVPKLTEKKDVFQVLKRCLNFILILLSVYWVLTLTKNVHLGNLLIALAGLAFLSSLESIFFDKVTATYCSYSDLPFAINTTRLANTIGYILGPLIGSIFFSKLSFSHLFLISIFVTLFYRIFLFCMQWNLSKNSFFSPLSPSQKPDSTINKESILYLYGLNFIWLNLVGIMIIPYYSLHFTVSEIGVILSFAGVGMLVGNFFSMSALKRFNYAQLYRLSTIGLLFSLCMIALFGSHYFFSCCFICIGSFVSSVCYALAQYFSLSIVDLGSLSHFYGIRNFINTLISLLLFLFLWFLISSSFSLFLRDYFNLKQAGLMSLFFLIIAFVGVVLYVIILFRAQQAKQAL